jgi:predicted Zn-dependent protease
MRFRFYLVSLCLVLSGCGSQIVNPVTGEAEYSVMTESAEIAEGRQAHQQVLQEYGAYNNPALQSYVNALGQKLAHESHRNQLEWHFTVLDSPEINAFALPGGYVYVTRGIMAYMESEADLAGVIGHEIGHVTARHGAQRATSQQKAGVGVFAAAVLGAVLESQGIAGAGQLASDVSQTVAAGLIASYGREQELQADSLGAEYLARTRYNPRNMVNVIKVLKNQERFAEDLARDEGRPAPKRGDWLASHPSNDQRLEMITQLASQYDMGDKPQDDGRMAYLKAIAQMNFGESPAQGVTRGAHFYHESLGFALTAPEGWRIQNSADDLAVVSPAGDVGVVVNLVPQTLGDNHGDIIRTLLQPSQGRSEATQINGLQATRFHGSRKNKQGQSTAVEATVINGPLNHVFVLLLSAKNAQGLQAAKARLLEVEGSFRALTPQDRQAARPWVIKTVPYPAGGFAELAKTSPIARPEQQLRLINGYYGGGSPSVGSRVKVVDVVGTKSP